MADIHRTVNWFEWLRFTKKCDTDLRQLFRLLFSTARQADELQSGPEKIVHSLYAPSFSNHLQKNHTVFTEMLRKDHRLQINAKSVSVG